MQVLHHRQPVLLDQERARRWLDPNIATAELEHYFVPQLVTAVEAQPVSSWVNNARNKDLRCAQAIAESVVLN
jgi:putative SOS response-associated peptidase YedK